MSKQGDKMRYNIKDYLSDKEVDKLMDLFNKIKLDLSDDSFPTRTNRLEAVENMKKVLEIHNYVITEYDPEIKEHEPQICTPDEMTSEEKTRFADALDHHQIMQKGVVR